MRSFYPFIALFIMLTACRPILQDTTNKAVQVSNNNAVQTLDPEYWYQGKAEINTYELKQSRYGEIRDGHAVLVFVTEDFLTDKQVKNDNYTNPNSTPILKTNYLKRFTTGIYDYSIMSSVFTPVDVAKHPQTLKVTTSVQDWCGQSFMQLNHRKGKYNIQQNSYFESEGDQEVSIPTVILEDEIFNRIRLNPNAIPTGKVQVLPATHVIQLMHLKNEAQDAVITKSSDIKKNNVASNIQKLTIEYPKLERIVEIVYEGNAPHKIKEWSDTFTALNGEKMTTSARLKETMMTDYWSKNGVKDQKLRKELGL